MIYLNGKPVAPAKNLTLARLLESAGRDARLTVLTVDDKFVPPAEYKSYVVPDGAKVTARELLAGG
ncbi:MAG: sulfur carrier protein ThiS [Elusimicrobia bacterium]|nr:sulfur carrier protein ThiS [Elusimicrobiota bacterium]